MSSSQLIMEEKTKDGPEKKVVLFRRKNRKIKKIKIHQILLVYCAIYPTISLFYSVGLSHIKESRIEI